MNRGSVHEKYLEIQGKKKKNHFEVFIWKACKSSSRIMRYFWKYARMSICEVKEHLKKKFKIDNCINPNVGTNHTSRRFFTIRNDLMKDYKLQRVSIFEKEYGFHRSLFTCLLQWHDAQVHFICLWGFISLEWYLNFTSKLILSWNIICSDLEVDYESEENASMVYAALAVDKEVILHDA